MNINEKLVHLRQFIKYNQDRRIAGKKKVTANKIYDLLLNEFKIKEQIGSVEIILGGISAKYNGKDAIGDLLQEWLGEWLKQKNFYFRTIIFTLFF